jgi:uncharacterized phage protein (TIGR01671 family)
MREILFRGKRTDNGEWVYGYYVVQNGSHQIYFDVPGSEWNIWNVDHATVGQYIGETDKNGVKIFEGDRVLTDEAGWIGHVTFGGGEFYVTDKHGGYARCCNWSDYEVLGTIHDAPEGEKGDTNV